MCLPHLATRCTHLPPNTSIPHVVWLHRCLPRPQPADTPPSHTAQVFASFGGLLMQLSGDPKRLEDLDVDQALYILIRKV